MKGSGKECVNTLDMGWEEEMWREIQNPQVQKLRREFQDNSNPISDPHLGSVGTTESNILFFFFKCPMFSVRRFCKNVGYLDILLKMKNMGKTELKMLHGNSWLEPRSVALHGVTP